MQFLGNVVRWFVDHWKSISAMIGSVITGGTWFSARRKDRKANAIDSQVLSVLQRRDLWHAPRARTGSGDPVVRSAEIAEALSLDCDKVTESLERLEARHRVRNAGGTFDNPAPYWHILHR